MQLGKGCEGIEGWMADDIEIGGKNFAVETGVEGLDEDSSKGFGFMGCKSCPSSIEFGVGVGVDAMKQVGDSKVG